MTKEVRSTESLYGVHPQQLAEMTYREALEAKKAGLLKRRDDVIKEMFAANEYQVVMPLQTEHKRILKALAIVQRDLDDIREAKR